MSPEALKLHCDELEDLAFRGSQMPDGLPSQDQALFLKFRCLYQYAKQSNMSLQQGKQEKQEILVSYITDCLSAELYSQMAELLDNIRELVVAIAADPDLMESQKIQTLVKAMEVGGCVGTAPKSACGQKEE